MFSTIDKMANGIEENFLYTQVYINYWHGRHATTTTTQYNYKPHHSYNKSKASVNVNDPDFL